jgi:hypothetical protein
MGAPAHGELAGFSFVFFEQSPKGGGDGEGDGADDEGDGFVGGGADHFAYGEADDDLGEESGERSSRPDEADVLDGEVGFGAEAPTQGGNLHFCAGNWGWGKTNYDFLPSCSMSSQNL